MSGLVVSAVMLLVVLASTLFFNQIRDYQQCVRHALTQQATSACQDATGEVPAHAAALAAAALAAAAHSRVSGC